MLNVRHLLLVGHSLSYHNSHHPFLFIVQIFSLKSCPALLSHGLKHPRLLSLSLTVSWGLLKLMFIESVMTSNHLILCHPLLLLSSVFPRIRVFSNELALCIRWPKYCRFSLNISPSNEYSGLISFRIHWFDILAVPPAHSTKASILWCSAFLMVHLSHPYMTTGKP